MKIEALLPYLLADVPGVPDITAKQALILTAMDFCRQTLVWDEIQDPVDLEENVGEYDLDVPIGASIAAVKGVWCMNQELAPVTLSRLAQIMPNWSVATGNLPVYYNSPADSAVLRVYPIPVGVNGTQITIRAAYAPTLTANTLPDSVVNEYLDTLVAGAKHRLMMTPGKSWSNPQLSAYHRQEYEDGLVKAKIDILHERVQGSITAKPRRFGV